MLLKEEEQYLYKRMKEQKERVGGEDCTRVKISQMTT